MSGKRDKAIRRSIRKNKKIVAKETVLELMNAPFRYRFGFCMKILFRKF